MSSPIVPPPSDGGRAEDPERDQGRTDALAAYRQSGAVIDGIAEGRRRQAHLEAREIRSLAELKASMIDAHEPSPLRPHNRDIARRSLIAELATAARVSEWTIARLMGQASDLCERFGAAVDSLESGAISRRHVSVIHEAGMAIDGDAGRAEYLELVLARAEKLAPGALAPVAKSLAERFIDRSLDERQAAANDQRRVEIIDLADGMSMITATLNAALAHGIFDRLTQQARFVLSARKTAGTGADADVAPAADAMPVSVGGDGVPGHMDSARPSSGEVRCADAADDAGDGDVGCAEAEPDALADTRTMDQVRADVFTDLLLTGTPSECLGGDDLGAIRATVQVTVPVLTMTGASDEPCLLAGYGPIDPETARALAGGASGWERVMTDPVSGRVLAVDRYRPGADLQRFLAARDEHCRFPGCRRPVWRCDIDHTVDWDLSGPTAHDNLAHLCRRHHTLKHASAWTVEQVSAGVMVWTSPSGRRHTDRPEPMVRFIPDDEILDRRRRMQEPWLVAADDPGGGFGVAPF